MKHLWLKWAVVPVVVLLVPAVWLGVRYASDREAENRIREKYSALVRYGTIVRMIDVHEKCERHAQSASDLARLVARGRGEKPNFDTAQKIRKQCQALPYPSDQDVNWLNKNQLTVYHEMEEILIATGRFQERNQVATERIMRDALQQLIEVEARLGTIEMMR